MANGISDLQDLYDFDSFGGTVTSPGQSEEMDKFIDTQGRADQIEENNNKRAINSLNKQLKIEEDQYTLLRDRLNEEIKRTNEIDNQNKKLKDQEEQIKKNKEAAGKLKEAMTAVGEEIETSIKGNLRDAITGAQSFGQAMTNVLNKIRDKLLTLKLINC